MILLIDFEELSNKPLIMVSTKTLTYGIFALAIVNYVGAEEESSQRAGFQFPSFSGFSSGSLGGIEFPNFGGLLGSGSGSGSSSGSQFPFNFPGFGSLPFIPGLGGSGSRPTTTAAPETTLVPNRKRRQAEDPETNTEESENPEHESRLFFSRFPTLTSCNFTTQAGSSCVSCRQALRCLPNNLGLLTSCAGLFRFCNNGRCSLSQGALCSATTSTSTTTTTTTTTSTTPGG